MPNNLRKLRRERGLTQLALQTKTGIEQALLSKYETGQRVPPTETLILLADFYGVSIDYLLGHKTPAEDDERQLLARYRSFTPSQKRLLLDQAELITRYKVKAND